MTNQRRGRRATLAVAICFVSVTLLLVAGCVSAQDASILTTGVGFNQHVTEGRLSPFRVSVAGDDLPVSGRLLVEQTIGSGWRGESTVTYVLAEGVVAAGAYDAALPMYETSRPVTVRLIADNGVVLAEETVAPSLVRHARAFPVLVSVSDPGLEIASHADAKDLPGSWWGYDSVDSLWIGAPLSRAAWTAIARWVRSGGSLVLFTGSLFHLMDGPIVRELLPLGDPNVMLGAIEQAPPWLVGPVREGAIIYDERDGRPLVTQRGYGAGRVTLVSVAQGDLTPAETEALLAVVPSSIRLDLGHIAATQLSEVTVISPRYEVVALLVFVLLVLLSLTYGLQRRRFRVAVGLLVIGVLGLTVLSGFYSNDTNHMSPLYSYSCNLQIETSFGFTLHSTVLYSLTPYRAEMDRQPLRSIPIQVLPATGSLTGFSSETSPATFSIDLIPGRVRLMEAFGIPSATITFALSEEGDELRVDNAGSEAYGMAWFIVDGRLVSLASVPPGVSTHRVRDGRRIEDAVAELLRRSPAVASLYSVLQETADLGDGTWLLLAREGRRVDTAAGIAHETDIVLRAVSGGEHAIQT